MGDQTVKVFTCVAPSLRGDIKCGMKKKKWMEENSLESTKSCETRYVRVKKQTAKYPFTFVLSCPSKKIRDTKPTVPGPTVPSCQETVYTESIRGTCNHYDYDDYGLNSCNDLFSRAKENAKSLYRNLQCRVETSTTSSPERKKGRPIFNHTLICGGNPK